MIKYFCDFCGEEIQQYNVRRPAYEIFTPSASAIAINKDAIMRLIRDHYNGIVCAKCIARTILGEELTKSEQ